MIVNADEIENELEISQTNKENLAFVFEISNKLNLKNKLLINTYNQILI